MEFLLAILLPISIWVFRYFEIPFWVAGIFLLPLIFLKKNPYWGKSLAIIALVLGGASLLFRSPDFVYFYPVMVNIVLLAVFISSLFSSQTIVEKIARLRDSDFSEREIPYARKVTLAWSLFFVINGCVAFITVMLEDKFYWSIYNGAISYVLMGLMFAGEFYCRKRYIRRA
jgi:uncharacterized membrane protein